MIGAGRGPIRLHKTLAWIHGPAMVLTPILGGMALPIARVGRHLIDHHSRSGSPIRRPVLRVQAGALPALRSGKPDRDYGNHSRKVDRLQDRSAYTPYHAPQERDSGACRLELASNAIVSCLFLRSGASTLFFGSVADGTSVLRWRVESLNGNFGFLLHAGD